jgi:hypothetical protein
MLRAAAVVLIASHNARVAPDGPREMSAAVVFGTQTLTHC